MNGEWGDAGLPGLRLRSGPRLWVGLALLVAVALAFLAVRPAERAAMAETAPAAWPGPSSEVFLAVSGPDLKVSQTASPNPALPGGTIGFSISVTNPGSQAAQNVVLVDSLSSSGTSFISAVPSQGSCQFVQCNLGSIAAGAAASVTIFARVDRLPPRTISSRACVSANPADSNGDNNCETEVVLVLGAPATPAPTEPPVTPGPTQAPSGAVDLSVAQVDAPDPVVAGTSVVYFVTVTNSGPGIAFSVSLVNSLRSGLTLVSATASQGSCTFVSCALGPLPPHRSATVTIIARVLPGVSAVSNLACASTTSAEPILRNNCATEQTTVLPAATPPPATPPPTGQVTPPPTTPGASAGPATPTPTPVPGVDLLVTVVDSPDPAHSGGILTFGITVANRSSETAHNVNVQDTLPSGVSLISSASSQGPCTEASCSLGDVPAGQNAAVALVVEVGADVTDTLSNTACATADGQTSGPTCDQQTTTIGVAGSGSPTPEQPSPLADTATPSAAGGGDSGGGGSSWVWWVLLSIALVLVIGGGIAFGWSRRRTAFWRL